MPATISVNFASQAEVETAPQPTNKSVSAKVLADVLGGGSLGGGYVRIAGSTMTGALTLNGGPTSDLHAATKKYVDDNAFQRKYIYNITVAGSTVSGNDANGNALSFVNGTNVDVYRNGVLLVQGTDYTVNVIAQSITFTTALAVGAVIQVNVGGVGSVPNTAGVTQILAGTGITLNPGSGIGAVTVSVTNSNVVTTTGDQSIAGIKTFTGNVQIASLGVGTPASGTAGEIRATNNITAFFSSDIRLKENISPIKNSLDKLSQISGVTYDWTDEYIKSRGGEDSFFVTKKDVGVIAQEVQKVLPEIVAEREDGYLAIKYERLSALLIEAVKELSDKVKNLEAKLNS
jgi:hypothetical protein